MAAVTPLLQKKLRQHHETGRIPIKISALNQFFFLSGHDMETQTEKNRIYHYQIDTEGRLWIEGTELTDPQVLKFFMRKMEKLPDGKFRVMCMGETNLIEAEDVPYVIQKLDFQKENIQLIFPGGYQETLDPKTLFMGKNKILYCKIRGGEFVARFHRRPFLELGKYIEEPKPGHYVLRWGGKDYLIGW